MVLVSSSPFLGVAYRAPSSFIPEGSSINQVTFERE